MGAARLLEVVVEELDRDDAAEDARDELSRPEYAAARPPWWLRLVGRVVREVVELVDRAAGNVPGGRAGVVLLLLIVIGLVAVVVARLRPTATTGRGRDLFAGSRELSAAEHRALADSAAAAGRFDEAVRERLRAVVRELESRGVLDPRPGRTAGEVARDGGAVVPALAEPLRRAAGTFDAVWYGGRVADAASYRVLVEVDTAVTGSRLVTA